MLIKKNRNFLRKFASSQEGSTTVVLAITFPLFIGATILATEAGYWRMSASELQNTADMASIAGAYEFIINGDKRDASLAAYADALDNEFKPENGTIVVNIPPTTGDYTGNDAVEVVITQTIPFIISDMFLDKPIEKTVIAITRLGGQTSESCVLSLNPSGVGISVFGNVDVNLSGCGLHSNSTSSSAIEANGSVTISAGCMSAVGQISTGNATINLDECAAPRENQPASVDPYSGLALPPGVAGMPCQYAITTGKGKNKSLLFPSPNANGDPVKICNSNIDLTGVTNLDSGTYIFDGTDIDFGSHAQLHGDEVSLLFMNNAELSGMNGNNTLNLTAPTSGDYNGVVMYADRDTMSTTEWNFSGNADVSLDGLVYLPTLNVRYAGGAGGNSTDCTRLVANQVRFVGNSSLESSCDAYTTDPIRGGAYTTVALVE